jgi:hypothetical protein
LWCYSDYTSTAGKLKSWLTTVGIEPATIAILVHDHGHNISYLRIHWYRRN